MSSNFITMVNVMARKTYAERKKEEKILSEKERIERKGKMTPLEFMLETMWNKDVTAGMRLEAAKSAAPYVHRKMPLELENSGEIEIIPPFVPSRGYIANMADEMDEEEGYDEFDDL